MSDKISKIDAKRQQIYDERRKRLLNAGVAPDKVDLVIAREDYDHLPLEKKVAHLENLLSRHSIALAQDLVTIRDNQVELANSFDTNFEAFAQMLLALGLSAERQKEIMEATSKLMAERRQQVDAQRASEAQKTEEEKVLATVDEPAPADEPEQPQEGVEVFGG